jgi:hypothetical protein
VDSEADFMDSEDESNQLTFRHTSRDVTGGLIFEVLTYMIFSIL